MVPALCLVSVFAALTLAKRFGFTRFDAPAARLRPSLSAMLLLTGSAHFGALRDDLVRMVPPLFPAPELIVTVTGVLELAIAVGLLVPRVARASAVALMALLLAMFPANVHAALAGIPLGGSPPTPLALRTALQLLFVVAALGAAGFAPRRRHQGSTPNDATESATESTIESGPASAARSSPC